MTEQKYWKVSWHPTDGTMAADITGPAATANDAAELAIVSPPLVALLKTRQLLNVEEKVPGHQARTYRGGVLRVEPGEPPHALDDDEGDDR